MSSQAVLLTPTRIAILQKLAGDGETSLDDLPKNTRGHVLGVSCWGPLVDAGFLLRRSERFSITDVGRKVLAKATRSAS